MPKGWSAKSRVFEGALPCCELPGSNFYLLINVHTSAWDDFAHIAAHLHDLVSITYKAISA